MEPREHTQRTPVTGGDPLDVVDISNTTVGGDEFLEDGETAFVEGMKSDRDMQELRIKCLKQAIDMGKLMSNVTVDDVINMATLVMKYVSETEI